MPAPENGLPDVTPRLAAALLAEEVALLVTELLAALEVAFDAALELAFDAALEVTLDVALDVAAEVAADEKLADEETEVDALVDEPEVPVVTVALPPEPPPQAANNPAHKMATPPIVFAIFPKLPIYFKSRPMLHPAKSGNVTTFKRNKLRFN